MFHDDFMCWAAHGRCEGYLFELTDGTKVECVCECHRRARVFALLHK